MELKNCASRRMHRDPLANYGKFKTQARRKTGKEECLDYKNCQSFIKCFGKEHVEGTVKNTNHHQDQFRVTKK
jgi:hypothetical protein